MRFGFLGMNRDGFSVQMDLVCMIDGIYIVHTTYTSRCSLVISVNLYYLNDGYLFTSKDNFTRSS